jgi:hypothetical protein
MQLAARAVGANVARVQRLVPNGDDVSIRVRRGGDATVTLRLSPPPPSDSALPSPGAPPASRGSTVSPAAAGAPPSTEWQAAASVDAADVLPNTASIFSLLDMPNSRRMRAIVAPRSRRNLTLWSNISCEAAMSETSLGDRAARARSSRGASSPMSISMVIGCAVVLTASRHA